jgi:guanylate kinase
MSNKHAAGKAAQRAAVVFVLSGPSGSGKTTLARLILRDRALGRFLAPSVSFTTRPRRRGERQGRDYVFLSTDEFRRNLRQQKVLEWTRYLGYYYGTAKECVDRALRRNKSPVLCLDIRGARRIKKLYPGRALTVFVMPPSLEELRRRIAGRKRESIAEMRRRLAKARKEMIAGRTFDYRLVNSDLAAALDDLKALVRQNIRRKAA